MITIEDQKRLGSSAAWISSGVACVIVQIFVPFLPFLGVFGFLFLVIGLWRLQKFFIGSAYASAMTWISVVAGISLLTSIGHRAFFVTAVMALFQGSRWPSASTPSQAFTIFSNTLNVTYPVAVMFFCYATQWLCREYTLTQSEKTLRKATVLMWIFYAIPFGVFDTLRLLTSLFGTINIVTRFTQMVATSGFSLLQQVVEEKSTISVVFLAGGLLVAVICLLAPWHLLTSAMMRIRKEIRNPERPKPFSQWEHQPSEG